MAPKPQQRPPLPGPITPKKAWLLNERRRDKRGYFLFLSRQPWKHSLFSLFRILFQPPWRTCIYKTFSDSLPLASRGQPDVHRWSRINPDSSPNSWSSSCEGLGCLRVLSPGARHVFKRWSRSLLLSFFFYFLRYSQSQIANNGTNSET